MTHDPSRKRFFAHVLGLAASVGVASKLLAKFGPTAAPAPVAAAAPVAVRPEARAVARRAETV